MVLRTKAGARLLAVLGVACLLACAKPLPLTNSARLARTRADLERMFAGQSPVTESIDLYGAMARAVTHNLEHRAQVLESMLEQRRLAQQGRQQQADAAAAAAVAQAPPQEEPPEPPSRRAPQPQAASLRSWRCPSPSLVAPLPRSFSIAAA